jgi:anthranilate phosphoribosyltransferase
MAQTFELIKANAMLLRGTEGEVVADARRMPQMDGFSSGQRFELQPAQPGTLATLPDLPKAIDAATTAAYIQSILSGEQAVPPSIQRQVEHILHMTSQL